MPPSEVGASYWHLEGRRPGTLLHKFQCTERHVTAKNYPVQNSARVEKTSSRSMGEFNVKEGDLVNYSVGMEHGCRQGKKSFSFYPSRFLVGVL